LCEVEFRLWRVYLFHTVSLEHVKRVALKEMKEMESKGECVKGTNMTPDQLGMNMLDEKTVVHCRACVRYFPIRDGNFEETQLKHCLTLNHIKQVEEYQARMKYLAKRDAEEKATEERLRLKMEKAEQEAKEKEKLELESKKDEKAGSEAGHAEKTGEPEAVGEIKVEIKQELNDTEIHEKLDAAAENDTSKEEKEISFQQPADEFDEDEIQLHADEDDEVNAPQDE